ncbi:MAG: TIGR02281 family clan AA aspartic protease [Sulfuritalea sp.]|nr:TIGR02281 family clan AA aspartic protease [Sulfuritalea sp.]MDP1983427.1 TIGR02281 family clan AA aspartic protease [Sulfuritalea sp.]
MFARIILLSLLLGYSAVASAVWVRLTSLSPTHAELTINDSPRTMRPGQESPEGVRLISISGAYAEIQANGNTHRLRLGERVFPSVMLQADGRGHYISEVLINGRRTAAMVDTGASSIAMSRSEADRLGIAYRDARKISTSTAGGASAAYVVNLDSVQAGSIELRNVEATISVLADSPGIVLLGMSFLHRVEMLKDGNRLMLIQRR